jgi:hypothetical protein
MVLLLVGFTLLVSSVVIRSDSPRAPLEARYRFGVGVAGWDIEQYDVEQLRAGWYVDWGAHLNPPEPAGMEYVQMVRLHQLTECWPQRTWDRTACPYVEPYTYTLTSPDSMSDVASIAQANPGVLWLIGNEMDRIDWDGGGQDEMMPELYAEAYHDLYHLIKDTDDAAQVAIGGVIQPTPLRLEYLDTVWDTYQSLYLTEMPVDMWNIHNMILREVANSYGADVPPGASSYTGRLYELQDADDIGIFEDHVLDFRQWMKDKGQRDKPLIISEYSVLYGQVPGHDYDYARVKAYLYATFDYMSTATSSSLGYPADGNRLVQRWAWYSLNDANFEGGITYHHLFDPDTKLITRLGVDYGTYPDQGALETVSIDLGWNLISLPVEPIVALDAEGLCEEIQDQGGEAVEVDRWYAGGWEGHICGLPFSNFPIELGLAYLVRSNVASQLKLGGYQVNDAVPLDLNIGWNTVSVPHTGTYTGETLCTEIGDQGVTALEIDRWQAGGWEGHICGLPFNDFAIETGRGYLLKAGSAGEVTPASQ